MDKKLYALREDPDKQEFRKRSDDRAVCHLMSVLLNVVMSRQNALKVTVTLLLIL